MRFDKLRKQLDLLLLLSDTRDYSIDEICDKLGLSHRNFYYLIDFIKKAGFILFKRNGFYHVDRRSPFFAEMMQTFQMTDDEVRTLYSLLNMAGSRSTIVCQLRKKIENTYNVAITPDQFIRQQMEQRIAVLKHAINKKRMVKLVNYSSPNSQTIKDRIVEPFLFLNNDQDVRCYELSSNENKTFKLSRIERVELLEQAWVNERRHRQMFTDIFMFTSEERHRVVLKLGQLSANLFREEYPQGQRHLRQVTDGIWILDIEVCDFRGLGRFVLGLFKDIEILQGEGFKTYIHNQINDLVKIEQSR